MKKQRLQIPVNVMLTPQFYTIKREPLPVQYGYQAKRIAPSLFDGLLDDTKEYHYFVSKENNGWLFIAYNIHEIALFLESKGILAENVRKVFFAEQSVEAFLGPVKIGEREALVKLDDSVVVVPQTALDEDIKVLQIDNSFTPKKGIALEGTTHSVLSTKQAYTLAVIFFLFSVVFFIEGSRYGGENAMQEEEMKVLLEEHPSLQSAYTRKSIADKYKTIDSKERKKREIINALSHMIFKGTTLTSLALNDKKFQAQFSYTTESVSKKLQALAKKEKFNIVKISKSHSLKIEGSL
jgi:hypothetical protein